MSLFDEKTGTVKVRELAPEQGDLVYIENLGTHYEITVHRASDLALTDEDIARLRAGAILFN